MSEQERAAGQAASTEHVGGGATEGERGAIAREIGAMLARAREAQRLSVEDVSARLKVAAPKLAAIESGQVEALPDVTFAKGVMRAYARMLQVDIDALLGRFHSRPSPVAEIAHQRERGINETFDDRKRFRTGGAGGRRVWLALVLAGLGAGGWFGFDHLKLWLQARNPTAAQPVAVEEHHVTGPSSDSGTVSAALPAVMAAADSPAPSEDVPASAPVAGASAPAPTPAPAPAVAAVPAAATVPAAVAASAPAPQPAVAAPAAAPATAGQGELQIRFSADTWYEIRDRGGKVIMGGTAKAGQEVAGGGHAPYKVVIGNVKGVETMTRNGTPVDLKAANRNNVARLTLP